MDPTRFDLPPLTRRHSAADECSDLLQPAPLQNLSFYLKATDSGQRLCLCKVQSLVFITVIPQSIFHLDLLAAIVQSSRQPLESQFDPGTDLSTTAGCINKADVEASRGNTSTGEPSSSRHRSVSSSERRLFALLLPQFASLSLFTFSVAV